MTTCPSQLNLEEYLLDPKGASIGEHVEACARCGEQLAEMRRLTSVFERIVYPETAGAVLDSVERRPWVRILMRYLAAPALVGAAATCALMLITGVGTHRDVSPNDDYVGTKGASMGLTVFARTLDGSQALADGSQVRPGTALRFEVRAPGEACRLWLVSIDGLGHVSRLYPTTGTAMPHSGGPLPGGVFLDDRTGPERFYAVCSREPLDYAVVERATHEVGAGGDCRVREAQVLGGLPRDAEQASLLLEKAR